MRNQIEAKRGRRVARMLSILAVAVMPALHAISYTMVSDADLVRQADAIVIGTVLDEQPGPEVDLPTTLYLVRVERVLEGQGLPGTIAIELPGGERTDGRFLRVQGVPRYRAGDTVLLFLGVGEDGVLRPLHLVLGSFRILDAGSGLLAVRDLSAATEVVATKSARSRADEAAVRGLDRFADWIEDAAHGDLRAADYWRSETAGSRAAVAALRLGKAKGETAKARWFTFQEIPTPWYLDEGGIPGLDGSAISTAFDAALLTWGNVPAAQLAFVAGGFASKLDGLLSPDGRNGVTFGDANVFARPYSCVTGGLIAATAIVYEEGTEVYNDEEYHPIVESDVTTNSGTECLFAAVPTALAATFTHELGHALGFGESADRYAAMYSGYSLTARAGLGYDDVVVLSRMYGDASVLSPGLYETRLAVAGYSASSVTLVWANRLERPGDWRVEVSQGGGQYGLVSRVSGKLASIVVTGLEPGQYGFRVKNLAVGAEYSNVAVMAVGAE